MSLFLQKYLLPTADMDSDQKYVRLANGAGLGQTIPSDSAWDWRATLHRQLIR